MKRLGYGAAAIVVLALGLGAWARMGCSRPPRPRPNVILIVIDTLRADRLTCYGYPRPTSPSIDALAAQGVLFEDCVCQAPWTLPSMSSMFTGRYLTQHREWPERRCVTLAEAFQRAGYAPIGLSPNALLLSDPEFGWARGFDHYDAREGGRGDAGRPFDELAAALWPPLEKALEGNPGGTKQPLFVWLQPIDPHFPYKPHSELDGELPLDGAEPVRPEGWQAEAVAERGKPAPAEDPGWRN